MKSNSYTSVPENLQLTEICWNRKGNWLIYTRNGCENNDFDLIWATIAKTFEPKVESILCINKQVTWYKHTIQEIKTNDYRDTTIGITGLQQELKFGNTGLTIATNLGYMTNPDKRKNKLHSLVIIVLTNKELNNKYHQNGIKMLGQIHKT